MDKLTQEKLTAEVHQAAATLAKRWPTVGYDELQQQAWLVALEHLPKYAPTQGDLGAYIGRVLRLSLRNHAYRTRLPVHFPKNKEYQFAKEGAWATVDPDTAREGASDTMCPAVMAEAAEGADGLCEAVVAATATCPEVRPVLMGKRTTAAQAARVGCTPRAMSHKLGVARRALRERLARVPTVVDRRAMMRVTTACPEVRPVLLGSRTVQQQAERLGLCPAELTKAVDRARKDLAR